MKRLVTILSLPLLVVALAGCGSGRSGEDELMRRVAQADEAARKAEAAAARAESAAARATSGSAAPETVYEEAPASDEVGDEPADPEPLDG